jgi:hypothetical protein
MRINLQAFIWRIQIRLFNSISNDLAHAFITPFDLSAHLFRDRKKAQTAVVFDQQGNTKMHEEPNDRLM